MKTLNEIEPRVAINSLPFTIVRPGSYYLTTNLTGVSGENGITVQANNVSIDLSGFSLIGVSGALHGIRLDGTQRSMSIRNGRIYNWPGDGVSANGGSDNRIEEVHVFNNAGNGLLIGNAAQVRGCSASFNGYSGFAARESLIQNSLAISNVFYGFFIENSRLKNSVSRHNRQTGIRATSSSVTDCLASQNGIGGIFLGGSSFLQNCTVLLNVGAGVEASGVHNRIDSNLVVSNTVSGIRANTNGFHLIVRNKAGHNGSGGKDFEISSGNQYGALIDCCNVINSGSGWENFRMSFIP